MWPWGHLAVGYLLYRTLLRAETGRAPTDAQALALAVGTQFPDLVDKPLAWTFALLPNGRSLAHSLVTATLVVVALEIALRRVGRGTVATAFGVGYLSHLGADALQPLLAGEYYFLGFLAWPLVPPVEYATAPSLFAHLESLSQITPGLFAEALFGVAVFALWLRDGAPGVDPLKAVPRWMVRKLGS